MYHYLYFDNIRHSRQTDSDLGVWLYLFMPAASFYMAIFSDILFKKGSSISLSENRVKNVFYERLETEYEPPHGKTNNLHRRKQRRRSASQ